MFSAILDIFLVQLLRAVAWLLSTLPAPVSIAVLEVFIRLSFVLLPKLRAVSLENLKRAFPEKDKVWRDAVLRSSYRSLARLLVDLFRLQKLDSNWVDRNVDCPFLERFREIKRENPGKGIVIATGHLGSFEILAHAAAIYGHPLSFVVRNAKLPRVDNWWRSIREANGNKVISRKGAFKEIMREVALGRDVGILFDQNVTINHAVFVDWFGRPAATTKSVALSALRTESPVIVAGVAFDRAGRYRILAEEVDVKDIYQSDRSADQKVYELTDRVSRVYQRYIAEYPEQWFWMHRRWKTQPSIKATQAEITE